MKHWVLKADIDGYRARNGRYAIDRAYRVLPPDKEIPPITSTPPIIFTDTSPWAMNDVSQASELNLLGNTTETLDAQSYVERADMA